MTDTVTADTLPDAGLHQIGLMPPLFLRADALRLRVDTRRLDPLDPLDPSAGVAGGELAVALSLARQAAEPTPLGNHSKSTELVNEMFHRRHRLERALKSIEAARTGFAEQLLDAPPRMQAAEELIRQALALVEPWLYRRPHVATRDEAKQAAETLHDVAANAAQVAAEFEAAAQSCTRPRLLCQRVSPTKSHRAPQVLLTCNHDTGELQFARPPAQRGPLEVAVTLSGRKAGVPVRQSITVVLADPAGGTACPPPPSHITRDLFESQIETLYTPDPKTLVLTGLDLTLEQSQFAANYTTVNVYGYIVRVPASLRAPGVVLRICARFLDFGPGVSVDVSGRHGDDDLAVPEAGDASAKQAEEKRRNGANGRKGGKGEAGGAIHIRAESISGSPHLIAHGGRGGRGQNGGKGADGVPGANGIDGWVGIASSIYSAPPTTPPTPGAAATPGGNGGNAGQRGDHGNGGIIDVMAVAPFHLAEAQASPGQCFLAADAREAEPGKGGNGAKGGTGGKHVHQDRGRAANGKDGAAGRDGDPPPEAVLGQPREMVIGLCSAADLCRALAGQRPEGGAGYGNPDSAILSMVLFGAERLYLNARDAASLAEVRDILHFLLRLTRDPGLMAEQPKLAALYERSGFLANNLAAGLDVFGKAANAIPALALARNEAYLQGFLRAAAAIEQDYDAVWLKDQAAKNWKEKIEKTVAQANGLIDELRDKVKTLGPAADRLMDSINRLRAETAKQFAVVEAKRVEFQEKYAAWQASQMLIGTLKMAWSLAMVSVNTASVFNNALPMLKDIFGNDKTPKPISFAHSLSGMPHDDAPEKPASDKDKDKDSHQAGMVEAFGKVKGGLKECYDAYQTYFTHADWTSDTLKIVPEELDREAFDKEIDALLDVPGAAELKDEVHKYLDLVRQRNEAIVSHDSTLLQLANTRAQIRLAEREAAEVTRELQEGLDPRRPIYVQYLRGCLQLLKSYVIETLHDMARSAAYYTLEPATLDLTDYRTSMLELQHQKLLRLLQKSEEQVGALNDRWFWLNLRDADSLTLIRAGKPVWFAVPLNTNAPPAGPFAHAQRPMVHRVTCVMEGLVPPAAEPGIAATISLMHSGICTAWNEERHEVLSFGVAPRAIAYQYDVTSGRPVKTERGETSGDLTEDSKFVMLSPFTLWGVQIARDDGRNAALDLSSITGVRLNFLAKAKTLAPL